MPLVARMINFQLSLRLRLTVEAMGNNKNNKSKKGHKKSGKKSMGGVGPLVSALAPHTVRALRYPTQAIAITESAAGTGAYYTFAINNVNDPDFSGAGNQPIGLDQWTQFYGRYRVLRLKYRLFCGNVSSPGSTPVMTGVYFSPQSTLPANPTSWLCQPTFGSRAKILSNINGGTDVCEMSGTVKIHDVFGVTKNEYMSEMDFAAVIGTNPSRVGYMHVWILGNAVTTCSLRFWSILEYDTELSQPVALGVS